MDIRLYGTTSSSSSTSSTSTITSSSKELLSNISSNNADNMKNNEQLSTNITSYNLKGLKAEISRKSTRLFKKAIQANDRVSRFQLDLNGKADDPSSDDTLKLEILQIEAKICSEQLKEIKELEDNILNIKSVNDIQFLPLIEIISKYNITDTPPPRLERGPKKIKTLKTIEEPRKPYNVYTSLDNIEIRVGRRAEDNDELTCNPAHRDSSDWWLHAAGNAGSHVVIRCHDDDLPIKFRETLKDAAVLAAKNSKASGASSTQVTYTRCRNVSKPPGVKAGLVYVRGDTATIQVNFKKEKDRLARLTGEGPPVPPTL